MMMIIFSSQPLCLAHAGTLARAIWQYAVPRTSKSASDFGSEFEPFILRIAE